MLFKHGNKCKLNVFCDSESDIDLKWRKKTHINLGSDTAKAGYKQGYYSIAAKG